MEIFPGWQRFPLARVSFHESEREGGEKRLILRSLVADFRDQVYPEVLVLESDFPYILCFGALPSRPWV